MDMMRDRTTSAAEATCSDDRESLGACAAGEKYVRRSLNDACPKQVRVFDLTSKNSDLSLVLCGDNKYGLI